jgi:hypothetical protein
LYFSKPALTYHWMRKTVFATCTLVCLISVAAAAGATIVGTNRAETIRGTARADVIHGRAGNDKLYGLAGNDRLVPGAGKDRVFCGPGRDVVQADALDVVAKDCEVVRRPKPPTKPQPKPGSRENPYPFGSAVLLSDGWRVRVESITPDATAAVLAENMFNDPPPAGDQFFIARVSATYTGAGSESFGGSFRLRAVGASAVSYSTFEDSCGVIPDEISSADVFTGGTVSGNVCWQIRSSDAASLLMYDDAIGSDTKIFFSLR